MHILGIGRKEKNLKFVLALYESFSKMGYRFFVYVYNT